jgi:hypothetical protein
MNSKEPRDAFDPGLSDLPLEDQSRRAMRTLPLPYPAFDTTDHSKTTLGDDVAGHIDVRFGIQDTGSTSCETCGEAFFGSNYRANLKRHVLSVHGQPRTGCPAERCDITFNRRDNLVAHIKNKHSELLVDPASLENLQQQSTLPKLEDEGESTSSVNARSFDTLLEDIPRSIGEPWSKFFPRVGDSSPGAGVMLLGPRPDSFSNLCPPHNITLGPECHTDPPSVVTLAPDIGESFFVERNGLDWHHQLPTIAFGSSSTNSALDSVSDSMSEMSWPHPVSQATSQSPSPSTFTTRRSPSQSSTTSTYKSKAGRRHGYRLSKAGAQNAKYTRQLGSCWYCFLMKMKVEIMPCSCQELDLTMSVFSR